jgi:hypothetical protein
MISGGESRGMNPISDSAPTADEALQHRAMNDLSPTL